MAAIFEAVALVEGRMGFLFLAIGCLWYGYIELSVQIRAERRRRG